MPLNTLSERWDDEILTDNTKLNKCEQCKTCAYRDNGDVWSNDYRKACCQVYEYPDHKPSYVFDNTEDCEYYEPEE